MTAPAGSGASPARDGDTRLAEIATRAAAATPGPWEIYRYKHGGGRIHLSGDNGGRRELIADMEGDPDSVATVYSEADREFLFEARSDVPWLIARLAEVAARHQPYPLDDRTLCRHCGRWWPCADAVTAGETE